MTDREDPNTAKPNTWGERREAGAPKMISPGVRHAVLDATINLALRGGNWKEITKEPLRETQIPVEEVESELKRRLTCNWGLTREQEADLETYINRWQRASFMPCQPKVKIAPPDDAQIREIKEHVSKFYALFEMAPPKVVICQSPLQLMLYLNLLLPTGGQSGEPIDWSEKVMKKFVHHYIGDQFDDDEKQKSYVANFYEQLKHLCSSGLTSAGKLLTERLVTHYFDRVHADLKQRIISTPATGEAFINQLGYRTLRIAHPVSAVSQSAFAHIKPVFPTNNQRLYIGLSSMISLITFGFAKERLGMFGDTHYDGLLMAWIELFTRAHYYAFCENVCFVGLYPVELHFNKHLTLEDVDGRAMRFSDGFSAAARQIYMWAP